MPVDERQQVRQRQDEVGASRKGMRRVWLHTRAATGPRLLRQPAERVVVKDDRHAMPAAHCRSTSIAIAFAHRGLDRGERCSRRCPARGVVQAPMREGPLEPVRVRPWEAPARLLVDGKDRVDFNRGAERKTRAADGNAGMAPLVAEDLDHQVRRAVDHFRMLGKVWRGVDISR